MDLCGDCYKKVISFIYPQKGIFSAFLDGECSFCDKEDDVVFEIPANAFMVDRLLQSYLDLLEQVKND